MAWSEGNDDLFGRRPLMWICREHSSEQVQKIFVNDFVKQDSTLELNILLELDDLFQIDESLLEGLLIK